MTNNKQVSIEFSSYDGYTVSITNNGFQWTTIYKNKIINNSQIINDAFIEVGYFDVTDYEKIITDSFKTGDKNNA